jgi:hypothetical protein
VGDEDEGDAERLLQRLQFLLHVFAQLEVERTKRLVEQKHLRLVDQGAGERDALALAAGKLARAAGAVTGKPDQRQCFLGGLLPLQLADTLDHQPVGDVVEHVQMREQRVVLEDGVDVAAIGRNAFGAFAENGDRARCRLLEAGDQTQAGGLAGTRRSKHGEELARHDVEIDHVDGAHIAEMARDFLEGNG